MSKPELRCVFASMPKTERGKFIVLGADRKGQNFLYANGTNIYIRDINDPTKCDIYSEHTAPCTMAQYSPSGFYIASGDATGKVRIWDTVNPEHVLKKEFHVQGGPIKDISWSEDNTKIAVAGEGRERCCKVITSDSGNTVGEIGGHTGTVNAIAFRPVRPFRIVSAGEDMRSQLYKGPPFKYEKDCKDHTNFVNCVRYSPTGDVYITGGADGQAIVYNGESGDKIGVLGGTKSHAGGVYGVAFSPDGKEVLTVSGDKTAKIWNVESREEVTKFELGKELGDMLVSCVWSGDNIIVVLLKGYINYLDRNNPSTPIKTLRGHNKLITAMTPSTDRSKVFTTSLEAVSAKSNAVNAVILAWDINTGLAEEFKGHGHTNQVFDMVARGDYLISVSMDDTCRYTSISSMQYGAEACKLPSQPKGLAALDSGLAVIACMDHVVVVNKGNVMFQQEVKFGPTCADISPDKTTVAFGGKGDLHIFELDGMTLRGKKIIKIGDDVMRAKFSPDGAYLAVCTGSKRITYVYNVADDFKEHNHFTKQTAKIFSLDWAPNSQYFATGSLDGSFVVWCLSTVFGKEQVCSRMDAHKKCSVSSLAWLSDNTIITASNDCTIKQWDIKFA
ncbi:WD repeat-containing protein 1-like [Mya arenaria]|uniref:WD repeat-containing protein 1-like n=1 Tax=Mya arenaria TaxID=6604 RepID=UPI0022E4B107|nr:WD repeat-containing protein 1-like [Mya arenaria]